MLTILTTTYNRSEYLDKCYLSLKKQTCKDFEWLVIDDGSNDNTEQVMEKIASGESEFSVRYYKKTNGGKHTAWNYAHQYIRGEYILILDDDDVLVDDAVDVVLKKWSEYSEIDKIGCLSFQKKTMSGKMLVDWNYDTDIISNMIEFRVNAQRRGDCAEVVKTSVFKEYPAPVFFDEKFLREDFLWVNSAYKYDTVYIRKVIYLFEYLEDGLTRRGHKMQISNPYGGMYTCNLYFDKRFKLWIRIRNSILFNCYALASGKPWDYIKKQKNRLMLILVFPISMFFFLKWSK